MQHDWATVSAYFPSNLKFGSQEFLCVWVCVFSVGTSRDGPLMMCMIADTLVTLCPKLDHSLPGVLCCLQLTALLLWLKSSTPSMFISPERVSSISYWRVELSFKVLGVIISPWRMCLYYWCSSVLKLAGGTKLIHLWFHHLHFCFAFLWWISSGPI